MDRRGFLNSLLAGVASLPFLSLPSMAMPTKEGTIKEIHEVLSTCLKKCYFELNDEVTRSRFINDFHNSVRKIDGVSNLKDVTSIVHGADPNSNDMEGMVHFEFYDGDRREIKFGVYHTGVTLG